jgi:hypothetical protein
MKAGDSLLLIRPISEDEVIAEFMKSELENPAYGKYRERLRGIVSTPDLNNQGDNDKRRALLFLRHRSLWKELPTNTIWYEAEIREGHLDRIRVFPRAQWRKLARGNYAVPQIAKRIEQREQIDTDLFALKISNIRQGLLKDEDLRLGSIVLIGINEKGPFTILDGNHRFISALLEGRIDRLRIFCGLSLDMNRCCWYRTSVHNLMRYARNLVQQGAHSPETELKILMERSRVVPYQ